jgi:biopolymer transport protein TolQ
MPVSVIDTASTSFSLWSLFIQADWIIKAVILVLIASSVISWAIIFSKSFSLPTIRHNANQIESVFGRALNFEGFLNQFSQPPVSPHGFLIQTLTYVLGQTDRKQSSAALETRIHYAFETTIHKQMEALEKGMLFVAAVASTGVLVGLFGTVWGIMNSFESIAATGNTTLSVVAPAIAEALFATALGLIAAIPAFVANIYIRSALQNYERRLEFFAEALLNRALLTPTVRNKDV